MSIITDLISPITAIVDRFVPDATKKMELVQELATLAEKQGHEIALAQIDVNKAESQSGNLFASGWRPYIGWTCGFALSYQFVLRQIIVDAVVISGHVAPPLTPLDMSQLMPILLGLLGLGTMRTVEYVKGVMKK